MFQIIKMKVMISKFNNNNNNNNNKEIKKVLQLQKVSSRMMILLNQIFRI